MQGRGYIGDGHHGDGDHGDEDAEAERHVLPGDRQEQVDVHQVEE